MPTRPTTANQRKAHVNGGLRATSARTGPGNSYAQVVLPPGDHICVGNHPAPREPGESVGAPPAARQTETSWNTPAKRNGDGPCALPAGWVGPLRKRRGAALARMIFNRHRLTNDARPPGPRQLFGALGRGRERVRRGRYLERPPWARWARRGANCQTGLATLA